MMHDGVERKGMEKGNYCYLLLSIENYGKSESDMQFCDLIGVRIGSPSTKKSKGHV